jgi:hypothetical protein
MGLDQVLFVFEETILNCRLTITQESVQIPLDSYFNNKGIGSKPGEANFDQLNNAYVAASLPQGKSYTSTKTGVSYIFPGYQEGNKSDNVIMAGQIVQVPESSYFGLHMLVSAETASVSGNLTLSYTDGTTSLAEVRGSPYSSFLSILVGEVSSQSYFTANATNFNYTQIYEYIGPLDTSKSLASITLPDTSNETSRIHLFSVSLWKQSGIQIQYVRPTQKHDSTRKVQTVELLVDNAGPEWISGEGVEISVSGPGIETAEPGYIKRLRPGDQKKVNVGIIGAGNGTASIHMKGSLNTTFSVDNMHLGLEQYSSGLDSLSKHESPDWFHESKYGIFLRV